jgi:AcrR family transcriptional regulator
MQPTQQQILDQALTLFVKQGYEKTSLTEISKQIGITKHAIYYYYESKDNLVLAVLTNFLDQVEQSLFTILNKEQPAQVMLQDLLTSIDSTGLFWVAQNRDKDQPERIDFDHYLLLFEGIRNFPEIRQRLNSIYTNAINLVIQKIRQAQNVAEIRADIDPEILVFQFFSILEGAYLLNTFYPNEKKSSIGQEKIAFIHKL